MRGTAHGVVAAQVVATVRLVCGRIRNSPAASSALYLAATPLATYNHLMPELPESVTLDHVVDLLVDLEPTIDVGATPYGRRAVLILQGGTFAGPRLNGRVHAGGGDWVLFRSDGVLDLDVRATLETGDGALIHFTFTGLIRAEPQTFLRAVSGDDVSPSEYYFRATPHFESSDEQYAWLNGVVCAGSGYIGKQRVALRVFALQ